MRFYLKNCEEENSEDMVATYRKYAEIVFDKRVLVCYNLDV